VWRGLVRQEARVVQWLGGKGLPAGVTQLLLGIVKIAVFGALLYAVFWLALLLLFAIAAAWMARNTDWDDEQETEWRTGPSGFGQYRGDIRIDIGDPREDD